MAAGVDVSHDRRAALGRIERAMFSPGLAVAAAVEPKSLSCPFLGKDNRCTIYEVRPVACAEYPYTDKAEISSRTYSIAAKALECPAMFHIVKQMRASGFK